MKDKYANMTMKDKYEKALGLQDKQDENKYDEQLEVCWSIFLLIIWMSTCGSLNEDDIIKNISVILSMFTSKYRIMKGMIIYTSLFLGYHIVLKPLVCSK